MPQGKKQERGREKRLINEEAKCGKSEKSKLTEFTLRFVHK